MKPTTRLHELGQSLAGQPHSLHVDLMDGHFVPSISFGAVILAAIAGPVPAAGAIVDAHLMIEHPERHVADIARAGADSITLHVEATPHLHYALSAIREAGCRAAAAVSPGTRADSLAKVAHDALDLALCMSADPGWGAQQFLPASLNKLQRMRSALPAHVALEVDGGIHQESIASAARAGANVSVTGSGVFASDDPAGAYAAIVAAARGRVRLDEMVEVARAAVRTRPGCDVVAEPLRRSPQSWIPEIDVSGKLPLSRRPLQEHEEAR